MPLSRHFNLLMASSPGFGSYACYQLRAINTRFPYGSVVLADLASSMNKLVGSFFNRHAVVHPKTNFNLLKASSSGFGSHAYYIRAIHTRFPCDSRLSPLVRSMQELVGSFFNRHAATVLRRLQLLVSIWFQVYFNALTGLLFTFPSRY